MILLQKVVFGKKIIKRVIFHLKFRVCRSDKIIGPSFLKIKIVSSIRFFIHSLDRSFRLIFNFSFLAGKPIVTARMIAFSSSSLLQIRQQLQKLSRVKALYFKLSFFRNIRTFRCIISYKIFRFLKFF